MHFDVKFTARKVGNGFLLIELMVVISIMSLIAALALPNLAVIQIRAARAEMHQNINAIYTVAKSFHAENDKYPADFSKGISVSSVMGTTNTCSAANEAGFQVTNCDQLRYMYFFGSGLIGDTGRQKNFTISAISYVAVDTGWSLAYGHYPTRLCKVPWSTLSLYFIDQWVTDENRVYTPFDLPVKTDALKNCSGDY